jgi:pimeloyl-ACP methyl ester carboxylesterase
MLNNINWIAICGGPGLSNNYLQYGLRDIIPEDKLHFYNLAGSPESQDKDPTIVTMVQQIEQVAQEPGLQEYGLITHSFGNYLALRSLERNNRSIKVIIMINPMPFEFQMWKNALTEIGNKVPEDVLKKITELSQSPNQGAELFRMIYPYYIGVENSILPLDVPFDADACNRISAKIEKYDDRNLVKMASIPLIRIMGDKDPFFFDPFILEDSTLIMEKVGHYPFFENRAYFLQTMQKVGSLLGC